MVASEDADGVPILRCRVEEGLDMSTGLVVQKRTTFRVEFLFPPSSAIALAAALVVVVVYDLMDMDLRRMASLPV